VRIYLISIEVAVSMRKLEAGSVDEEHRSAFPQALRMETQESELKALFAYS